MATSKTIYPVEKGWWSYANQIRYKGFKRLLAKSVDVDVATTETEILPAQDSNGNKLLLEGWDDFIVYAKNDSSNAKDVTYFVYTCPYPADSTEEDNQITYDPPASTAYKYGWATEGASGGYTVSSGAGLSAQKFRATGHLLAITGTVDSGTAGTGFVLWVMGVRR